MTNTAAWIALAATGFNLAVTLVLWHAHRITPSRWLQERGIASTLATALSFLVAVVLVNRAVGRPLGLSVSEGAILGVAVLSAAAQAWWLVTFLRGRK